MTQPVLAGRWFILNGLPMFARVNVDAAPPGAIPVVHVHGFGISGSYLVPTAARLAAHYPTYVPDLPGYGRSHKPGRTLTIPELADALAGFLDLVGVERAVLLGNSMGCLVSIEFAHKYPQRIERAILVSPAGGPHNQPLARGLPQLALDGMRESPRLFAIAVPDYLRFGVLNAFRLFHAMSRYPTVDEFVRLTLPILIVVGVRDPLVSKERMKLALELRPNIRLVFYDGAAHAINYSHPVALASIVHAYLEDRPLLGEPTSTEGVVVVGAARLADAQPSADVA
jgi:pimeloyl-ACP methyl ester carboxylesterase